MRPSRPSEPGRALRACAGHFLPVALFSAAINVLYLASPLYMLQVYDRVISSGSIATLVMLTLVLLFALGVMAVLDWLRSRILARAGLRLDRLLSARVLEALLRQANQSGTVPGGGARGQALRDLDTFRQFITAGGAYVVFDAPWAPIYIAVIALLSPWLGAMALAFSLLLLGLALLNERLVSRSLMDAGEAAARGHAFADASLRNAHVVEAMGMLDGLLSRWGKERGEMLRLQARATDRGTALSSLIRFCRLAMQSVILGAGAWLVIERQVTSGAMFAATILLARALMPVEQAVGMWRQFVGARAAWQRLVTLLTAYPAAGKTVALPTPKGALEASGVTLMLPGLERPVLHNVGFSVAPGETLGIIGPSGSGKSSLARLIVGIQAPTAGTVRLDGANVARWARADFGRHVGYLPQEIELFADSVAANIARLGDEADDATVAAAQKAGVHDMVLGLPHGYETQVGEAGANLSGGHRQRIALARALYGDPSLVVLDEPSSNLDSEGDAALARCLEQLKAEGRSVVVISHRLATLNTVDKLLVLQGGAVKLFGPRRDVLAKLTKPTAITGGREAGGREAGGRA